MLASFSPAQLQSVAYTSIVCAEGLNFCAFHFISLAICSVGFALLATQLPQQTTPLRVLSPSTELTPPHALFYTRKRSKTEVSIKQILLVSPARLSRAEKGSGALPIIVCTAPKTGWSRNAITKCGFHNNVVLRYIMPAVQLVASYSYSLESRPSPFRDRFTHAHIHGRVYGKIRNGKERAWDTSPESWVMFSDVIVF